MAEGQPYPTVSMLKMMNRRNELEAKEKKTEEEKLAILKFQEDHVIKTQIVTDDALMKVITLFKIHMDDTREGMDHQKKIQELRGMMQFVSEVENIDEIEMFYSLLIKQYITGRYVFYGVLKDSVTAVPFDLKEDQNKFRLITTKECGSCGNNASQALSLCTVCKKAAYCNRECQKADYAFHKLFCKDFAKQVQ